jgi:amino acid transporter
MEDQTAQENKINLKHIAINTTTIITLFTLFFYVVAYRYETGYKSYFHIPDKLIELNILTIIRPNLPFATMLLIVAGMIVAYFTVIFGLAYLMDKYLIKKFFSKRFIGLKDISIAMKVIPIFVFVILILSAYSSAYTFGKDSVLNMRAFWTIEQKNEIYAVVDTYNGNFICVPIDIDNATFKAEYIFVKPEEVKDKAFKNVLLKDVLHEKE